MVLEIATEFEFDSTTSCNDLAGLVAPPDDHDGVVEGTFGFLDELLSTSPQH